MPLRLFLIAFFCAVAMVFSASGQQRDSQPKWEQVESAPSLSTAEHGADGAAVRVHDMHIYIDLEQPAHVKLFTILGQPVSQMQLPAGTSRLRVSARGIYILKIGAATRRVTI